MDKQQMLCTLERTLHQQIIICGLLWIFALLSLFHTLFSKKIQKDQKITEFILAMVILVGIPLFRGDWCASAFRDIKNEQIICCEAIYERDETYKSRFEFFSNGKIYVRQDESGMTLVLPKNWTAKQFPKGEYYGTIFYSKESKVILAFFPQDTRQGTVCVNPNEKLR